MSRQALPYVLILGLLFGITTIVSRFSVGQYAPTTFIWLRLALSALAFAAVYLFTRRPFPRSRELWHHGTVLGVFGTAIPLVGYVSALEYLSAGVTSLLLTIAPAVIVLFAHFLLPDEKLNLTTVIGIAMALGGALFLALSGESGLPDVERANPIGYALIMVAIVVDSLMIIYARKYTRDLESMDLSSIRMVTALIAVAPLSLYLIGFDLSEVTPLGYAALVFSAAIGTFGGLWLGLWVTQTYGATAVSMSSFVVPIVATVGGILLLGETFTPTMLIGMALIISGLLFLNRETAVPFELT